MQKWINNYSVFDKYAEKKNNGSCKNCHKFKKQKRKNKLINIKLKKRKREKTTEQNKKEKLDIVYCIREAQYHCYNLTDYVIWFDL